MNVPEAVRRQAVHPNVELPPIRTIRRVDVAGVQVSLSPWPTVNVVEVLEPAIDVAAAVEASRELARKHRKGGLAWWIAPEHDHLAESLEDQGLVNEDTPGFEAVENAMALVEPPTGRPAPDVDVTAIETFEDYLAASRLGEEIFGMPAVPDDELEERFVEMRGIPSVRSFLARVDGRAVGSAFAVAGYSGVNLFGGGVHPDARGRGVYGALLHARWRFAVEAGTPALTVQAGRMSRPICERFGFVFIEPVRVFVDPLAIR